MYFFSPIMPKDHLLVNHAGFLKPLLHDLESRDIKMVYNEWKPTSDLLERTLACYIRFYDCFHHPIRVLMLKKRLAPFKVPLITWNQDAPHYLNFSIPTRRWRLWLLTKLRIIDIYATHTLIDKDRQFADLTLYLPNAANTDSYNLHGDPSETLQRLRNPENYRWDVSFFGGMNGQRYKEDLARQVFFSALSTRLDALKISHRFIDTGDSGMPLDEQIALIQSSRINLNFGARCEYNAPVASGLPERCYGIPACGGFLLCDTRTHARDDFTPGENWAEFDDLDDCVNKIVYWLANFDKARDLAERCYHHVIANHTYAQRAKKLHNAILAWHKGKRGLIK
jgi:spore maturation protein CgeB